MPAHRDPDLTWACPRPGFTPHHLGQEPQGSRAGPGGGGWWDPFSPSSGSGSEQGDLRSGHSGRSEGPGRRGSTREGLQPWGPGDPDASGPPQSDPERPGLQAAGMGQGAQTGGGKKRLLSCRPPLCVPGGGTVTVPHAPHARRLQPQLPNLRAAGTVLTLFRSGFP